MIRKTFKAACFAAVAAAFTTSAYALESDRNQPIQISADQGSLDQANQVTTLSGNVVITQGTLNIRAANVKVSRNNKSEQFMTASGSPVRFSQTLDGGKGMVNGQADNVEYSSATGIVKLTGNAKVQRGGDMASGASITYNTRSEVYTVLGSKAAGGKGGKRVSIVIQPTTAQSGKNKK